MKLRGKTIFIVGTTLVCLLIILFFVSRQVLFSGFAKVERENTIRNVQRMVDAFHETINNISIKSTDWAKWDDMYKFIGDGNKEFIESNLNEQTGADLKLNLMFFVNTSGAIVYCREFENESGFEPSEAIKSFLLGDSLLMYHKDAESVVQGIVMSPEGPLGIASRPITTSQGTGPVKGAVVFARHLDSAEICRLAQVTHLSLTIKPCLSRDLPPDMAGVLARLNPRETIAITPLTKDTIAGYTCFPDIHGKSVLIGRANIGRAIYKQGQITMLYLIISIGLAGIIFGIVILLLLQKSVISPIEKLSIDVKAIGESGDHSKRVSLTGHDEMSNLAGAMNKMLGALQHTENVVREKNLQMRMIMNTVPSGLLSLDENFKVNPEYSKSVESILGSKGIAGLSFFDLVGLTENRKKPRQELFDFLDLFRQEVLPEKEMAGLNPFEEFQLSIAKGKTQKWIRFQYFLIKRELNAPNHLLVVVEDITEEKALAEKVKLSERENMQLKAIVEDPDLFRDFLIETRRILKHAKEKIGEMSAAVDQKTIVNEVFRDIHTIKGTASSFGLSAVSEIAGQMESSLSPLRETGNYTLELIRQTNESLALLTKTVMEAVENAKKIIGEDFTEDADIHLKISLAKLKGESIAINELVARELVDQATAEKLRQQIESRLNSLRLVPARKGLAKAVRIMPGLISRLKKKIVFNFNGADVPIDCEVARELNTPLIHLLRNACDHGIETESRERILRGKPAQGTVSVNVRREDHTLTIEVRDDGHGLDPEKLKNTALRKGVISEEEAKKLSRNEIYALIYRAGFSTAATVSEISGRGVGMDAVFASVKKNLHGDIAITSEIGKGTSFSLQIPVTL